MFKRSPQSRIILIDAKQWLFINIHPAHLRGKLKGFFRLINLTCKVLLPLSLILEFFHAIALLMVMPPDSPFSWFKHNVADWLGQFIGLFLFRAIDAIAIFIVFYILLYLFWIKYFLFAKQIKIGTQDIQRVKLSRIHLPFFKKSMTFCWIRAKSRHYCFGLFLPQAEKEWLVGELNDFLSKLK